MGTEVKRTPLEVSLDLLDEVHRGTMPREQAQRVLTMANELRAAEWAQTELMVQNAKRSLDLVIADQGRGKTIVAHPWLMFIVGGLLGVTVAIMVGGVAATLAG